MPAILGFWLSPACKDEAPFPWLQMLRAMEKKLLGVDDKSCIFMMTFIHGHALVCSVACVANIANTVMRRAHREKMERMSAYKCL